MHDNSLARSRWLRLLAVAIVCAAAVTLLLPTAIRAVEAVPVLISAGGEADPEEDVVVVEDDAPLVRQAKLKRRWTVFREKDSEQIWAIKKAGTKHEIQTLGFFTAFNANYLIKLVKPGRLDGFETGDPITDASLLDPTEWRKQLIRWRLIKMANNDTVWLLTPDGKRRPIMSQGPFHRFGWEFRDVEELPINEVLGFPEGDPVTDETVFDEEVDVDTSHKRKVRERLSDRLKGKGKTKIRHRLLKIFGDPKVYLLDKQGRLRHIDNEGVANRFKLNLRDLTEVTPEEAAAYEYGPPIGNGTAKGSLDLDGEAQDE